MKYRRRPIVVEAIKWDGSNYREVCDFAGKKLFLEYAGFPPSERTLVIQTLEGTMHACAGDYIIRGIKGELYPCKPDVFKLTYEPLSEPPKEN